MIDNFVLQPKYRSRYLLTIDNEQSIVNMQASPTVHVLSDFIYEKCKFDEALFSVKTY